MRTPLFVIVFLATLAGCFPEKKETPLRGDLHVLIPESIAPALAQQVDAFMNIYGQSGARVTYSVVTSEESIGRFLDDTLRAVFTTRALLPGERKTAEEQTGTLAEIRILYDGIAVVVHYKNPVSRITTTEFRTILSGAVTRWEQLLPHGGMRGGIQTFFQENSDVSTFLRSRFPGLAINLKGQRKTSLEILQAVVNDPRAIGIVGLDWIDSARVPAKVLEIAAPAEDADTLFKPRVETIGKFYAPHPAHIYRSFYPLKRAVYFYSRSLRGDLSSGFAAFLANKEGQRLFLERGLVPATQPIRLRPSE